MPKGSRLEALLDGHPLPDAEADALWKRFSAWMEAHPADLAGFANAEGFASIHPEIRDGGPVLIASRTKKQQAYAPAKRKRGKPESMP